MSTRVKRFLFGILGSIAFVTAYWLRTRKDGDPLGWLANIIQVLGAVGLLGSLLWHPIRTMGRCIVAFFWTVPTSFEWVRVLAKSGLEVEPMMLAFLKRYNEEEVCDIGGRNQEKHFEKHFVVTNFVAYSNLVSTVVHAAYNNCPDDSEVFCFTTLTMPLCKWFNFSEIPNSTFRHCQIHLGWENYTRDLRELLPMESVLLRRCILTVSNSLAKQNENNLSFPFKGQTEMQNSCNYCILVPESIYNLKPIKESQITNWLNGILKPIRSDLKLYESIGSAYLIHPNGDKLLNELPCPPKFKWLRLGSVFLELFHSTPQSGNARCKVLTNEEWRPYFSPALAMPKRIPEDLFIVGFRNKTSPKNPKWVLCLAADVDKTLDKLSLEFISEGLDKSRFHLVTEYVNWLDNNSEELQRWVKSE